MWILEDMKRQGSKKRFSDTAQLFEVVISFLTMILIVFLEIKLLKGIFYVWKMKEAHHNVNDT
jgi:hypothetical protein